MDSRKRSDRENREQENHKKRKICSLLLEIANFDKLKDMVNNQGVDVKETGYFMFTRLDKQSHEFQQCPALFAVTLLDKWQSVNFLVNKYPHFNFKKEEEKEEDGKLSMDIDKLLDILELVGAVCILRGDQGAVAHGLICWNKAMKLRFENKSGFVIRKSTVVQCELQKKVLRNEFEIEDPEDLNSLERNLKKNPNLLKIQAFLVYQRISTKYGCFPNGLYIESLIEFSTKDLEKRKRETYLKSLSRAYYTSLYVFKLFRTTCFQEAISSDPLKSFDLIHLMLTEYRKILEDQNWPEPETNSVLTFSSLMNTLWFCTTHEIRLEEQLRFWPGKHNTLDDISDLILVILGILVSIPKIKTTRSEMKDLKKCLSNYTNVYEKEGRERKPILLIKACRLTGEEEHNVVQDQIISLLLKTCSGKWGNWNLKFLFNTIRLEMSKKFK